MSAPDPDGRGETVAQLRRLLKARTGRTWSVTGGRGTAWSYITIQAPPARATNEEARAEDGETLRAIFHPHSSLPSSSVVILPGRRDRAAAIAAVRNY